MDGWALLMLSSLHCCPTCREGILQKGICSLQMITSENLVTLSSTQMLDISVLHFVAEE